MTFMKMVILTWLFLFILPASKRSLPEILTVHVEEMKGLFRGFEWKPFRPLRLELVKDNSTL